MSRLLLFATLTLAVAVAGSLGADDELGPAAGTRLRVTLREEGHRLTGTLASIDRRQLVLETRDSGLVSVPLGDVSRLETSRGTGSRWKAGAIVGALGGPAIACAVTRPCLGPGTVVLATLTGAVGAGIGHALKTERWEAVSLPSVRVSLTPASGGGFSAFLQVSF